MQRKTVRRKPNHRGIMGFLFSLFLLAGVAIPAPALADCDGAPENYRRSIVTYYETGDVVYNPSAPTNSLCTLVSGRGGLTLCRTRLRGALYLPLHASRTSKFPAIIVNHGSGAEFEADTKHCEIANYFVPRGFIVFAPFRRGQGDDDAPYPDDPNQISDKSTGIYVDDMVADFVSGSPVYNHQTSCPPGDGRCYRAELFTQQAEMEVGDFATNFLKNRQDVKRNKAGEPLIAIMGNSYGGAVTVLANQIDAGHRVAVAFAAAAQQWAPDICFPGDQTCGTPVQRALLAAARNAVTPAFYLQAQWDYDTRPTIDLAYAHAYGSSDPTHGKRFMASIFPYPKPGIDPETGDLDYQSVHAGFFTNPALWGPSVLDFIGKYGVK